ncbi:MAG: hypothetical protein A3G49_01560 [Candidatus Sungbacteria bacterium RIFCSPLOWO2_12_FULL_41_11]|uniref:Plasmid stabilization protein n=1 Tax=Candidatus Sungbacteria bacterium RIFCSPLOWO2_12_FULL_41_11 TaxID=1802286 RepID=A0A1G2LSR7_9BACT|nr:MAG: hypothetical protein A3D41_04305 [Candidatus Sungbacteria bacterium RIFCSPHIGHO2_02_FULL_41_12b]OHA13909.1 MAG: hypothetical protein A3G49_01560 [Candidatus Sungbacteria bacterium RIFCSPLOWO2_12_FULL_41_11]
MNWDYRLSDKALKNLKEFPKQDRLRIYEALETMKDAPFIGDIKPIQGEENLWRRRIGAYRIYFRPFHEKRVFDIPGIERKRSH